MEKRKSRKKSARLSREEWLASALEVLAGEGDPRLTIETICRRIGVSKGSFYWHFRGRRDFMASLLVHYRNFTNRIVMEAVGRMPDDPRRRLFAIMEIVLGERLGRYAIPMRAMAARDSRFAAVVKEGERQRAEYVRRLFRALGFRGRDLEDRTRLFIGYLQGENITLFSEPEQGRAERLRRRFEILCGPG